MHFKIISIEYRAKTTCSIMIRVEFVGKSNARKKAEVKHEYPIITNMNVS
jgi:hypothetical protein